MIYLFRWFNEAILRPTAIFLELLIRVPRALAGGFRAAIMEMGAPNSLASVISGFIVAGMLLGLLWLAVKAVRKFRMKSPSPKVLLAGTVLFWIGCTIGLYFLGLSFYVLAQPDMPGKVLYYLIGTAVFYPALGRLCRYILGR